MNVIQVNRHTQTPRRPEDDRDAVATSSYASLPTRVSAANNTTFDIDQFTHRLLGQVLRKVGPQPGEISRYAVCLKLCVDRNAVHAGLSALHRANLLKVEHDAGDDRYRITPAVRLLQEKLDEESERRRALHPIPHWLQGDA